MKRYFSILVLVVMLFAVTSTAALAQGGGTKTHYVGWGETLSSIAAQYGVSTHSILNLNGLANPNVIYVGQPLLIPISGGWNNQSGNMGYYQSGGYKCTYYHTVKYGESLSSIAWDYDITLSDLLQHNNMYDKNVVYMGQQICVPLKSKPMSYSGGYQHGNSSSSYHTVSHGETLSTIGRHYGVSDWDIARYNNLQDTSYIWIGQVLAIPIQNVSYAPTKPKSGYDNAYYKSETEKSYYKDGDKKAYSETTKTYYGKSKGDHDPDMYYDDKSKKDKSKDVYLRVGRNVVYEYWGRPKDGVNECYAGWYDDMDPVKRFTVEVIVTNKSKHKLSDDWASPENVMFYTASGQYKYGCKHIFGYGQEPKDGNGYYPTNIYPGDLHPGKTVDVTFYTHLEKGDMVTMMEFTELGICIEPNSGDRISCDKGY